MPAEKKHILTIKKTTVNILLLLAGTLSGILLAELLTAVFMPHPIIHAMAPNIFFVRYDEQIGWVNKKNAQGMYRPYVDVPEVLVRINQLSFRGDPVSVEKPLGVRRVVFLGDSNTFGFGVEESQRYSNLLARDLPGNYDLVNLGVFGYGTDQEAILLEREGLLYSPDIVVLALSAGDLSDNMSSINGGYNKPYFKVGEENLKLCNTPVPESSPYLKAGARNSPLKIFFYNESHLYRLLLRKSLALNRYMSNSVMEMSEEEGMNITISLIRAMDELCRMNSSRLVVMLIPHGIWIGSEKNTPGQKAGYFPVLKEILSNSNIPIIDTTEALTLDSTPAQPVFFPTDPVHLTAKGNEVVAGALFKGLKRHNIID